MSVHDDLLTTRGLTVHAATATGAIAAVDKVDLDVCSGDILGIIGESGSGKTTLVRSLIGLLERNVSIADGVINFRSKEVYGPDVNRLKHIRGSGVGMIFQSALSSLNPLFTIGMQLREVMRAHRPEWKRDMAQDRGVEVLKEMGFTDPRRILRSYPHQLSGGMRQRAAIALAVATEPALVIADECTSALDVTTQAEVVALLKRLSEDQEENALIFVTHDLLLAAEICTKIAVMYGGQIVEQGATEQVLRRPRHPYTRALLQAVPAWGPKRELAGIPGTPPRVEPGTVGCRFADRCSHVVDCCRAEDVALVSPGDGHEFRCILPEGLEIEEWLEPFRRCGGVSSSA